MLSEYNPSLKVLLVEDDASFTSLLGYMLHELGMPCFKISSTYESGLQDFNSFQPDLCLIDIDLQHPKKDGIDLASTIRLHHKNMPIVFITAHFTEDNYMRARKLGIFNFLSKELSKIKLLQAIELALYQQSDIQASPQSEVLESPQPAHLHEKDRLFFKVGDLYKAFQLTEILYFYADNKLNYARIGNRNFPTSLQLKVLENELYPNFLRCHKKYLVNASKIDSIHIKEDQVKIGDDLLPIGYSYKRNFLEELNLLK